jgi:hypothetical protein
MDQLVYDLIAHYEAEVLPCGLLQLELWMRGYGLLHIAEVVKQKQMWVCYWLYDAEGNPVPEPSLHFAIDNAGHWIPYEIQRHTAGHFLFADWEPASGELIVTDAKNQAALACFADFWAEVLRLQGWVGGAEKRISHPHSWPDQAASPQPPDEATLWNWVDEYGKCLATDACWVEPDGTCEHGHKSWLLELGLI